MEEMIENSTDEHNNKKHNTTQMASIHVTTLRKHEKHINKKKINNDLWASQDKEKNVEEEELGQGGK